MHLWFIDVVKGIIGGTDGNSEGRVKSRQMISCGNL